jgi:hypothetical protein
VLDVVADVCEDASGSDLTRAWNTALRRSVLNVTSIEDELLGQQVRIHAPAGSKRDSLWALMRTRLGLSNRQIAELAGVSHPTVGAAIKRAEGA